ncbi:plasma membrane-associated cation-binding protein 1 [Coffea arabica]|uniref:Plasma membrane-associated cation-binding protein 1 n=1 Tax=Coffea arabica TaxID=13443 RepID=A0A6P6UG28_COFAR|nr:plasma membrane-associated cation-binding protein 1-like [Coffea arabica]XP_027089182.1 plasma membrane-associated cation-binding protein 1-like [Coffea arabica]
MGISSWKEKVLPKIKKVFEKNGTKKAAAAEVIKAFEESKEQYTTEFEGKKTELEPKVVEVYEASPSEVKALIKEPKEAGLKKHSAAVQKFLDELVKIEFPGAKTVSEGATKVGPSYLSGPITFLFEKVSTCIPEEVKKEEEAPAAAAETTAESSEVKEKEIVVEAEKKEVGVTEAVVEKVEAPAEAPPAKEAKVEEAAPEAAPAPAPAPAAEPPKA